MPRQPSFGRGGRTMPAGGRPKADFSALGRAVRKFFSYYPHMAPLTMCCILFSSIVSAIPSLFTQNVIAIIERWYKSGDWASARPEVLHYLTILGVLYVLSLISLVSYTQIMAYMTQGFLDRLRREMFDGMQDLPISYFDTHSHGDIMSVYTNDVDTLRQFISQSMPQTLNSAITVAMTFVSMIVLSVPLTVLTVAMVVVTLFVARTRKVADVALVRVADAFFERLLA